MRVQNVVEKIFILSVVIEALKKLVTCMFLCAPFANRCLIYSDWAFEVTLHSWHPPDGIHPVLIHLIAAVSVIKRLSLHEFTLWAEI